jgi:hypothetical protein
LVLLDYSVNDADAKALYGNDERQLVAALLEVHDKVLPATMLLIQSYPFEGRQDRWGKRASSVNFSYTRAYKDAGQLLQ